MPVTFQPGVPNVYRRNRREDEESALRLVRTDIAGFVGYAERGPLSDLRVPSSGVLRLTSWPEFVAQYGGFIRTGTLAYAVRAFFENGGPVCHVARIAALRPTDPLDLPRKARWAIPGAIRTTKVRATTQGGTLGGVTKLKCSDCPIGRGDLIYIDHDGVTQFAMVLERTNQTIELSRPLSGRAPSVNAATEDFELTVYESPITFLAKTEGAWGNNLNVTLTVLTSAAGTQGRGKSAIEFSLRVLNDRGAAQVGPIEEEFYPRLSLDSKSDSYVVHHLQQFSNLLDAEVATSTDGEPCGFAREVLPPGLGAAEQTLHLAGGRDGLSAVTLEDFTGGPDDLRGLRLFEDIDEISILCAPDAVHVPPPRRDPPLPAKDPCRPPPANLGQDKPFYDPTAEPPLLDQKKQEEVTQSIQLAMLEQSERLRDRVAVLDFFESTRSVDALKSWRTRLQSPFGAIYFPWLKVPDALELAGPVRTVPPCGHVAGIYARLDREIGVHRPPANVALEFVTDVAAEIDDAFQQELNPNGVNAIRSIAGRGIRVWGARSLSRRDQSDWRFIHVRRFMCMLEESIEKSMKWAVFELNDHTLRTTLRHMIEGYLERVWRRGGLKGEQREQAFFVKCDETNNPPSVVDQGELVCKIGVAVAAPMEFIIFELRPVPSGGVFESREL